MHDVAGLLRRLAPLSLAVGLATLLVAQTPTRDEDEPRVIPLRVHDVCRSMSSRDRDAERVWGAQRIRQAELITHPCAAEDWLDAQIATASSLFASAGLRFRSAEHLGLAPEHARIGGVDEMWELAFQVQVGERPTRPFGLDVFLVDEMFSSADAGGTAWAHFGHPPDLIVVAVTSTNRALLAHELGHYMGLAHSPHPGNPMFETPGEAGFDSAQISHLRVRSFRSTRGRPHASNSPLAMSDAFSPLRARSEHERVAS